MKGFVPSFRTLRTLRHQAPTRSLYPALLLQKDSDFPGNYSGLTPPQPNACEAFLYTETAELERQAFRTAQLAWFGSPELMANSPSDTAFVTRVLI